MVAAQLSNVSKSYGAVQAVDDLSLRIDSGRVFGLLGPNGAGKTTTIRLLMGILRPDRGAISVLGAGDPIEVKRRLGYLPEEKGLYKKMRLAEFVVYFGRLNGLTKADASKRSEDLLERFGLAERRSDKCDSLSKGLGQKLQIVATLVHDPDLIVLDEPFSGLDPVNVELVRETILDLKASGRTVVLSTHVMEQAEQICDAIALINRGRVVIEGATDAIRGGRGDTVTVEYSGDGSAFRDLDGILRVNDSGQHAELHLDEGVDPQSILRVLVERITIHRFDTLSTSLHEVFVRSVADGNADARAEPREDAAP